MKPTCSFTGKTRGLPGIVISISPRVLPKVDPKILINKMPSIREVACIIKELVSRAMIFLVQTISGF